MRPVIRSACCTLKIRQPAAPQGQMDHECMRKDYAMFASIYVGAQNAQALQSKSYPAGNQ